MSSRNGNKTLIGLKQILEYLDVSEPTFKTFIEWGMPARVINRRWYAHKDNIDEFFRLITQHREKEIPHDAE